MTKVEEYEKTAGKDSTHLVLIQDGPFACHFAARNWTRCANISMQYDAVETIENSMVYQTETEKIAKERYA